MERPCRRTTPGLDTTARQRMNNNFRTRRAWCHIVFSAVCMLAGCATPKEYVQPTPTPLQDPLPGQALVYLLRSPYDDATVQLELNGVKVAELPALRYTAIQMPPGTHALTSQATGRWNGVGLEELSPFSLTVQADTRYFVYLPAPERKLHKSVMIVPGPALVHIEKMLDRGADRQWELTTERDAQWFMFYAKPMLPEKGAL